MFFEDFLLLFGLFAGAFLTTFVMIPKIRSLSIERRLGSKPNQRSSHVKATPNIGGIAFYVTMMVFYYFIQPLDNTDIFTSIIPGLTIMFIIGLKDDLVGVAPSTKIIAQITSGYFIAAHHNFELINLKGFLWVFQVDFFVGFVLVIAFIIVTVNAINLIDGIDGLAGVISIVIFSSFGAIFFMIDHLFLLSVNVVLVGSISAFIWFNIHPEKKIFMGDTGSLVIGFMISIMAIDLFTLTKTELYMLEFPLQNFPFLVFTILFIPLMDTIRVFSMRILNGKSPFQADKTHIHHILLPYFGGSHIKTSLSIGLISLSITLFYTLFLIHTTQTVLFLTSILLCIVYVVVVEKFKK
jgi:UDP-GlcNAc:undecaprenyl-phosphate/decaprenyl-phosphate GlcNAc-1-phosphate transferase